jgi:DNA-binding GntR family transcriptional regulator
MTELEAYLTLPEAARKYGVSRDALTRLARDGIIRAVHNEEGTAVIAVQTVDNATAVKIILDEIKPKQYEHLRGKRIRLLEASRQYDIEAVSLSGWVSRDYIYVHDRGFQRLELDAADVKYAVDVFKRAKGLTGSSIKAGWVLKQVIAETSKPSEGK